MIKGLRQSDRGSYKWKIYEFGFRIKLSKVMELDKRVIIHYLRFITIIIKVQVKFVNVQNQGESRFCQLAKSRRETRN